MISQTFRHSSICSRGDEAPPQRDQILEKPVLLVPRRLGWDWSKVKGEAAYSCPIHAVNGLSPGQHIDRLGTSRPAKRGAVQLIALCHRAGDAEREVDA
jgi:hypothetical protein